MIYDPEQTEEIGLLKQRLEYLQKMHSMVEEKTATEDDVEALDAKYGKVLTPADLLQQYKKLYGFNVFSDD